MICLSGGAARIYRALTDGPIWLWVAGLSMAYNIQPGAPLYWGNTNANNFISYLYSGGPLNLDPHRVDGAFLTSLNSTESRGSSLNGTCEPSPPASPAFARMVCNRSTSQSSKRSRLRREWQ